MSELNRANRNLELAHEEYIRSDDIADCADDSAKFWVDKNASMNSDYWQFIEIEMEV